MADKSTPANRPVVDDPRLRRRTTVVHIHETMSDAIQESVTPGAVAADKPADLEGLLQHARLRTRMFHAPFEYPILERYQVHEQLGKGGMGEVYKAWDTELQRFVAIKLMQLGLGDAASERLRREAQAMARIEHNHVVSVYDTGTWQGRLFVVMEYVQGTTLRAWQEAGERTPREILDAYVQAGQGLARIHDHGLVHRDFKPDNVMLDGHGRVVVGDLGLVHASRSRTAPGTGEPRDDATEPHERADDDHGSWLLARTLTHEGARVGTLRYMSPEQFRGQDTDARSDQFSFCVALYEALYKDTPFVGANEAELAKSVLAGDIRPRPSSHAIPGWLDAIVTRGLARDPDARFADMKMLLRELVRRGQRRKLAVRGTALVALTAVGVLVATQLLGVSRADPCAAIEHQVAQFWGQERRQRIAARIQAADSPEARLAWQRFEQSFAGASGSWQGAMLNACRESQGAPEPGDELATRARRERDHCLAVDRRFMQQVSDTFAVIEFGPRDLDRVHDTARALSARDLCTDSARLMRGSALPTEPDAVQAVDQARALIDESLVLELAGRYDEARERAEQALARVQDVDYWPVRAQAGYRLGHVLGSQGQGRAADAALVTAHDFALLASRPDLASEIAIYRAKVVAEDLRDAERGRKALIQAETTLVEAGRAPVPGVALDDTVGKNPQHADLLEARGLLAMGAEDFAAAREAFEQALAIRSERALGALDLDVSKSHNNLGNAWSELGERERALEHYREALRLREALLGRDHPLVSEVLYNLGEEYSRGGDDNDYAQARDAYERAFDIDARTHGPESVALLPILVASSNLEVRAEERGDAPRLERACAQIRRIHASLEPHQREHASRAMEHTVLGACHAERGEWLAALAEHTRAAEILEPKLDQARENIGEYLDTVYNLSESLAKITDQASRAAGCKRARGGLAQLEARDPDGARHADIHELRTVIDDACGVTRPTPIR